MNLTQSEFLFCHKVVTETYDVMTNMEIKACRIKTTIPSLLSGTGHHLLSNIIKLGPQERL